MKRAARIVYLLALSLWTGGLATISFVVAPTAFGTIKDRSVAGDMVGGTLRLFVIIEIVLGLLALAAALLLYARRPEGTKRGFARAILVFTMLVLALSNYLWIYPEAKTTREKMAHSSVEDPIAKDHFALIHRLSVIVVTANIAIGAGLLICAGWKSSDDS